MKEFRYAVLSENGDVLLCDALTWARFMEQGYRRIRQEYLAGYWISTVFLGLNHNYYPFGEPLWFETMIFEPGPKKCPLTGKEFEHGDEIYCERYSSLEEALQGHELAKRWFQLQEFDKDGNLSQTAQADDPARRF